MRATPHISFQPPHVMCWRENSDIQYETSSLPSRSNNQSSWRSFSISACISFMEHSCTIQSSQLSCSYWYDCGISSAPIRKPISNTTMRKMLRLPVNSFSLAGQFVCLNLVLHLIVHHLHWIYVCTEHNFDCHILSGSTGRHIHLMKFFFLFFDNNPQLS